ncbi:hypothetical protein F511_28185 [Dorcoceras hygrometricum]|uniref:Uncharacterized protein n=1 Tax=Dorcoceras hygrometricum TaxID=472368 RepID=A0A2Z7ADS7_9LAMI|nr:hypothetical protein F511_28185 [Dorcoceras hygrometricum]
MVKRLETSSHYLLGINDSACKNQLVIDSVQYGHVISNMPTESTTIGKSRVAKDLIVMHTSWRSNSDIACATDSIGYPHTWASDESSIVKHKLLQASGPYPMPPRDDRNGVGVMAQEIHRGRGDALRCMADAPTSLDQFSLVSPWFEPWLVSLEPYRPGGGPDKRAPSLVAGEGRKNANTRRWSQRRSMDGAPTCSDQFSLVSPRFETRSVMLEPNEPEGGPAGSLLGSNVRIDCWSLRQFVRVCGFLV